MRAHQQTEISTAIRNVLPSRREHHYASDAHEEWERRYIHKHELLKRRMSKGSKNSSLAPSTITAAATFSRTSGVAPLYVFVDMKATTSTQTSEPFHEILYKVDWGDSVVDTWTVSGASKNISWGPLAAHVYTAAGTFTVTRTYYDGVSTVVDATQTITVTGADAHYATTATVVVSTSGTFTGKPTGATEVTSSDFDAVIAAHKGTNKRILFRGGETFTGSVTATLDDIGPWTVGSFGTGRAIIQTSAGVTAITLSSTAASGTCTDGRILDLEIDGQSSTTKAGIEANGSFTNMLVRNCKIHDLHNAINFSTGILDLINVPPTITAPVWDKLCLAENDIDTIIGGSGGYGIFCSGTQFAVLGNDVNDTTSAEFPLRIPFAQRYLVQHNQFRNPPTDKAYTTIRGIIYDTGTDTIPAGNATEYGVFSDNYASSSGAASPAGYNWGAPATAQYVLHQYVIIESNYLVQSSGGQWPFQFSSAGGGRVSLRNNIVYIPTATSHYGLGIFGDNGEAHAPDKLWIYNNTVYDDDLTVAGFAGIDLDTAWTNAFVRNNLMYCPNGPTGNTNLVITGSPTEENNSTDTPSGGQIHGTDPVFVTTPPTSPAHLKIQTTSYAKNAGAAVPVYQDFFRTTRVGGTIDIGAHEFT